MVEADALTRTASPVSSRERRGGRRRAVVLWIGRSGGRPGIVGREAENVVGHPLRFSCGMKNLAAILLEHGNPGLEVARVIGNVARQSDHGSDGDGGQLRSKLFFRVKNRTKAAAQIAVQPRGMTAGVSVMPISA